MNLIEKNIDILIGLCKRHKVKELYIFGSILTTEFNDSSDVDFLVQFENVDLLDYFDNYIDFKEKLENLLVRLSPTPERLFEYNYNRAVFKLQKEMNAEPMVSFIQENPGMDYNHRWGAFSQLLYYYRDNEDLENQDKYYYRERF